MHQLLKILLFKNSFFAVLIFLFGKNINGQNIVIKSNFSWGKDMPQLELVNLNTLQVIHFMGDSLNLKPYGMQLGDRVKLTVNQSFDTTFHLESKNTIQYLHKFKQIQRATIQPKSNSLIINKKKKNRNLRVHFIYPGVQLLARYDHPSFAQLDKLRFRVSFFLGPPTTYGDRSDDHRILESDSVRIRLKVFGADSLGDLDMSKDYLSDTVFEVVINKEHSFYEFDLSHYPLILEDSITYMGIEFYDYHQNPMPYSRFWNMTISRIKTKKNRPRTYYVSEGSFVDHLVNNGGYIDNYSLKLKPVYNSPYEPYFSIWLRY